MPRSTRGLAGLLILVGQQMSTSGEVWGYLILVGGADVLQSPWGSLNVA